MMHWVSRRLPDFTPIEVALPAIAPPRPAAGVSGCASARSEHVRMLEHAATRRRRAAFGAERAYWKASAPAAVARAARVRADAGFAHLP